PRGDQKSDVRCESAADRANSESDEPKCKNAGARSAVAECTAEQHQCTEGEEVAVHHPLEACHSEAQVSSDCGYGNRHDAAFEEHCSRSENGRGENPSAGGGLDCLVRSRHAGK